MRDWVGSFHAEVRRRQAANELALQVRSSLPSFPSIPTTRALLASAALVLQDVQKWSAPLGSNSVQCVGAFEASLVAVDSMSVGSPTYLSRLERCLSPNKMFRAELLRTASMNSEAAVQPPPWGGGGRLSPSACILLVSTDLLAKPHV